LGRAGLSFTEALMLTCDDLPLGHAIVNAAQVAAGTTVEIQRFLDINPRGWPGVRDVADACDAAAEALVRDPDAPLALPLKD
jgi:hypothetical protein